MKSVSKLLLTGVSLIVLAITIMVVVFSVNAGQRGLGQFNQFIGQMFGKAGEPKFAKYSGQYVDGKTVRSTMEEFGGDFFIRVKTRKNPVSFVVAHKPVDYTIMVDYSGLSGMCSYVDSSSLCYVNENALFSSKVARDSSGTLLGITFTEKGAGAVTKAVREAYTPDEPNADIGEVRRAYLNFLNQVVSNSESSLAMMLSDTNSVRNATHQLQTDTQIKNGNLYPPIEESPDITDYETATAEKDAAKTAVDRAWVSLMEQCKLVTGIEPTGYVDITKNDPSHDLNDTSNLQFWVNLYENNGTVGD